MIRSIIRLAKYYRYAGNIKSLNNIFQEEYFRENGYKNYHDIPENKRFELNNYIQEKSKEIEDQLKKDLKNNIQYISWFYDIIKSKEKSLDDYKEIINIILEFNKIKNSLNLTKDEKNIQNYKTFSDLQKFVVNFKEENKKYNKTDFPLIYSNSKYNLYKIDKSNKDKFQELYGKNGYNLAWCIANKNQSYFNQYLKEYGGYYILWLTNNNKPFALFHDGSSQFKDIHNHELEDDSEEVLDGLAKGCKPTNFENDLEYYKISLIKYKNPDISDSELFVKLNPNAKLNKDGTIDYDGYVYLSKDFVKDGKILIKFNKVNGGFYCNNLKLISLKGCPKYVKGNFVCDRNQLINLDGCPEYVEGRFLCGHNKITTLKGSPKAVKSFDCSNNRLKNLEGAPKYVNEDFICCSNELESLIGCPDYIGKNLDLSYNKLTKLDCMPKNFNGIISFYHNNFNDNDIYTTLFVTNYKNAKLNANNEIIFDGSLYPILLSNYIEDGKLLIKFDEVNGRFSCYNLNLKSLDGCPKKVAGSFDCSCNQLTSLNGCPEYVGKVFDCSYNKLISLKHCPNNIEDDFNCSNNNLTNLEGCPKYVKGIFDCTDNNIKSLDYSPQKCEKLYIFDNPIEITDETRNQFDYEIIGK